MAQVTIEQIAEKAGVSRATAARIVNGDMLYTRPSYAKRAAQLRQIAVDMGYRPNAAAKAISTGKFRTVAMVLGTHVERSNFTREMIRGIHDVLQLRHMRLMVWFLTDQQLDSNDYLPAFLREQMVDGLLINYTHDMPPHMTEAIEQAKMPFVLVNVKCESGCVYPDDLSAGRQATLYLRELGHKSIAFADFVHGPANEFQPHYSVGDRLAGYKEVMCEAGLPPRLIEVKQKLNGGAAVARAVETLCDSTRPTAIVCQSPRDLAVCEVAAARTVLEVPRDLSLITFGVDRHSNLVSDPTRMVEPGQAMGAAAVEALFQRLDNFDQQCPARRVAYTLNPGETTAAMTDCDPFRGGRM